MKMLNSLPFGLIESVLSFCDDATISAVMCSSRELRDAVSATMGQSQAIVFTATPRRPYTYLPTPAPVREFGPTLQQYLHYYPPTLTTLSLRDCPFLTDPACKLLAARFPLLTTLDVSGCILMTSIGAKKFFQSCKNLTTFTCDATKKHSLRKNMKVNPAYIKALALSTTLTTLSLTLGSKIKQNAMSPLHRHPNLDELNLYLVGFNEISLSITLPTLRTLKLYRGEWSMYSWTRFFREVLPTPPTLPRLPSLGNM
jgi:hypothetical protein